MGYSIKELEGAATDIKQRLERRTQERGAELADRVWSRTAQGRGLWFIFLWPAWLLIFLFSGALFARLILEAGIDPPTTWLGFLGGFLFARAWYRWRFTIHHPFLGSVLGCLGTALGFIVLANLMGIPQ